MPSHNRLGTWPQLVSLQVMIITGPIFGAVCVTHARSIKCGASRRRAGILVQLETSFIKRPMWLLVQSGRFIE